MKTCSVHTRFFDEHCVECKSEYREMKGIVEESNSDNENDQDNKTTVYSNMEKYKELLKNVQRNCMGNCWFNT